MSLLALFALASTAAMAEEPMGTLPDKHSAWTGQEVTFANGAKIKVQGNTVTTMVEGTSSSTGRSSLPPPRMMASCSYMRHWLDTHPVNNNWRANSLTYMDRCF